MTVTDARNFVRQFARNAQDSSMYNDASIDRAIQTVCNRFIRVTKATKKTDTLAVTAGASTIDLSEIDDFRPERLLRAWISGKPELELTDFWTIDSRLVNEPSAGVPTLIGFNTTTDGAIFPAPDADYTINLLWVPPLTTWTIGATDDATALNLPDDWMQEILVYGATATLQHTEPEHKYASESWKKYLEFETSAMGAGNLGVRAVPRSRIC
jgi:hypothetical protein